MCSHNHTQLLCELFQTNTLFSFIFCILLHVRLYHTNEKPTINFHFSVTITVL